MHDNSYRIHNVHLASREYNKLLINILSRVSVCSSILDRFAGIGYNFQMAKGFLRLTKFIKNIELKQRWGLEAPVTDSKVQRNPKIWQTAR